MEQCPVCGVKIEDNVVYFSFGKPGTRARLQARVCQYIDKSRGCINRQENFPSGEDFYSTPRDLTDSQDLVDIYNKNEYQTYKEEI